MPARRMLVPLLAGALLLALVVAVAAGPSSAAGTGPRAAGADAGIQVEGTGRASAAPDVARITVGVEATEPTVDAALEAADEAARQVLDELAAQGVEDRDVRTVNLQVHPRYGREGPGVDGEQIEGYVARQDLAVTLRDVDGAGAVIGAVVAAAGDAARLQGMSFALEDDAALREQAREAAFADAREKAEQYARLAGRELGEVLWIREGSASAGPVPFAADEQAAGGAVPIAPGSTEVTVTAEVRWALA